MMILHVDKEFSKNAGGAEDGRRFRLYWLRPMFIRASATSEKLLVDLDGGYGYAASFLREAFGGLAREYKPERVLEVLEFKSDEEPYLADDIRRYIRETGDSGLGLVVYPHDS